MVPHRSSGISPYIMLYGQEPIMPEEINFIKFKKVEDHEIAIKNHIKNMIDIHELALGRRKFYINKMKADFNLKKVKKLMQKEFSVSDLVWMNVHQRTKSLGKGKLHWEGPCRIVSKYLGGLFNLE